MNRRIEHIKTIQNTILNQNQNLSQSEIKSLSRLIKILEFVSNTEYQKRLRSLMLKGLNKEKCFNEISQFFLDDIRWVKITNKRRTEYEELKKFYIQQDNRLFKIEEYIYMLERTMTKKKSGRNEYLEYLNDKK